MSALRCWNCGHDLSGVPQPISRHEHCQACFEPLHCCRLCSHYQPGGSVDCDEDRADPPVTKETANFCEWFRPSPSAFTEDRVDKSANAQDALQDLFADAEGDAEGEVEGEAEGEAKDDDANPARAPADDAGKPKSPETQARSKLDDLFSRD